MDGNLLVFLPLDPGSEPYVSIKKSQDNVPTEQGSVRRTYDADVVSPDISYGEPLEPGFHSLGGDLYSCDTLSQHST